MSKKIWARLEKYIEVEADSEEEAAQIALESDENEFSICHQCSDNHELAESLRIFAR
ncbi:MAG: hypothetical protein K2X93_06820 [Candidatus Obscuribacterales bacterium]|nr:hypothetical protein [Candidatus Obscuribacterales bacterium]